MTIDLRLMTTDLKNRAYEIADRLYCEGTSMEGRDYSVILDALEEIESLQERDEVLEKLWAQFGDIPMNPETECMEEKFLTFSAGTHREEIWKWFDQRHSKGVAYLMYSDGVDRTPETAKLLYMKQLCFECESSTCQFNHGVECRFALIHERKPLITDEDGCLDYAYCEEGGDVRRKMPHNAKLVVRVESDRVSGKIRTVSIFDNRTQEYWSIECIRERGCEWFLDLSDLKETLNWNLNGNSAKYQFTWGQSSKKKSEGFAYVFD